LTTATGNRDGVGSEQDIQTAIYRGGKLPGGVCGQWGSCGAALGVGVAFAVIL